MQLNINPDDSIKACYSLPEVDRTEEARPTGGTVKIYRRIIGWCQDEGAPYVIGKDGNLIPAACAYLDWGHVTYEGVIGHLAFELTDYRGSKCVASMISSWQNIPRG